MAFGMVAFGNKAGEAIFRGLEYAEKISWNCIGGFTVLAYLDKNGKFKSFETQRGGTRTLFTEGEETGVNPPEELSNSRIAGLIAGGPDRLEPLTQFLAYKDNVGIITGHRIPTYNSVNNKPINQEVLSHIEKGLTANEAIDKVFDENPECDTGLLSIDMKGNIGMRNSEKVLRNIESIGYAKRSNTENRIEVLLNEIFPHQETAELAAETGFSIMNFKEEENIEITVRAGTKVNHGKEDIVKVDNNLIAKEIYTTDINLLTGLQICIVPYKNSKIIQNDNIIGKLDIEAIVNLQDGVIKDLEGQSEVKLTMKGISD